MFYKLWLYSTIMQATNSLVLSSISMQWNQQLFLLCPSIHLIWKKNRIYQLLKGCKLLFVNQIKFTCEENKMLEASIKMSFFLQTHDLMKMWVIDMGINSEERCWYLYQFLDLNNICPSIFVSRNNNDTKISTKLSPNKSNMGDPITCRYNPAILREDINRTLCFFQPWIQH